MNNLPELRKIIADAPDHTAINVAHYDYGDLMHLLYLNCENEFYDSDEKRWVEMCLVDNYFHGHRKLSDLRTIIEKTEENEQLKAKVAELERENKGLSVALSMPTSVDALTTEAFALEQQAKGVQRLVDNWFDINILDSEDIEVVSAVRFINELRKQAKKLKGGAE